MENKLKFLMAVLVMTFLTLSFVSATEAILLEPENKDVFTTNSPVWIRLFVRGVPPITCVFEQKSSNKYFETEPNTYTFGVGGWWNMWLVNSVGDWHVYNGRYKLQMVCTDAIGNVAESELVKFHVKGDMKRPE